MKSCFSYNCGPPFQLGRQNFKKLYCTLSEITVLRENNNHAVPEREYLRYSGQQMSLRRWIWLGTWSQWRKEPSKGPEEGQAWCTPETARPYWSKSEKRWDGSGGDAVWLWGKYVVLIQMGQPWKFWAEQDPSSSYIENTWEQEPTERSDIRGNTNNWGDSPWWRRPDRCQWVVGLWPMCSLECHPLTEGSISGQGS